MSRHQAGEFGSRHREISRERRLSAVRAKPLGGSLRVPTMSCIGQDRDLQDCCVFVRPGRWHGFMKRVPALGVLDTINSYLEVIIPLFGYDCQALIGKILYYCLLYGRLV